MTYANPAMTGRRCATALMNGSMRLGLAMLPIVACLSVALFAGCSAPLPPPITAQDDGDDTDNETPVMLFEADADPEVAALPFANDEILAKVLPGARDDDLLDAYSAANATPIESLEAIQLVALRVDPDQFDQAATALATHPVIESVHKSYFYDAQMLPDDSEFNQQDHFDAINAPAAWGITTGDEDTIIAILDTGVESDHPDLQAKLVDGWNVYDDDDNTQDVMGHGTSVAGAAAAITDNDRGIAGVAWDNPIMPIRVSSASGRASSRNVAKGIVWAVDHGARLINASFAPMGADQMVLAAAEYARNSGAIVFISAGNNGKFFEADRNDNAVFVGAMDQDGELASFSDTGDFVDFVAPGTRIRTTSTGAGYRNVNGTSFAAPITAGVAALVWSVNPAFRPATVVEILTDTATDLGTPGRDELHGFGIIDAFAAVTVALDFVELEDATPPTIRFISPSDNTTVTGSLRISVSATDANKVADVVLMLDDEPFATDTSDPFVFTLNARHVSSARHTLTIVATDTSGNRSAPQTVDIIVQGGTSGGGSGGGTDGGGSGGNTAGIDDEAQDQPPQVVITSPQEGTSVNTSIAIISSVTDDIGLRGVETLVDGVRQRFDVLTGTDQVVTFVWNAATTPTGIHRITIRAEDSSGNMSSATVTLFKD